MTKEQDIAKAFSEVLLNNQHLMSKALFNAQVYIAELEQKLGIEKDDPKTQKGVQYDIATENLYRSEQGLGLHTERYPRPSFAPWYPFGLLNNLKANWLGDYYIEDAKESVSTNKD